MVICLKKAIQLQTCIIFYYVLNFIYLKTEKVCHALNMANVISVTGQLCATGMWYTIETDFQLVINAIAKSQSLSRFFITAFFSIIDEI